MNARAACHAMERFLSCAAAEMRAFGCRAARTVAWGKPAWPGSRRCRV